MGTSSIHLLIEKITDMFWMSIAWMITERTTWLGSQMELGSSYHAEFVICDHTIDITYVPTWSGWLYLAVVMDAWSRRVVGWAMNSHLRTQLVLDALAMSIRQRRPEAVIHHSDQGSQYTSLAFGKRCREAGVRPSMGSVGDCFDNALCESFFATLECELLERESFHTPAQARLAVFEFIEGWYNLHRLHSALDYVSPIQFERAQILQTGSPSGILSTETG
jgi:putative transposase